MIPKKYKHGEVELKWAQHWADSNTYAWQERSVRPVFAIDTPPPTVSGSLHIGHVFSYTHTDIIARFKRMNGFNVFYPMGWDDNGLPTERRVQQVFGITCDPQVPFDASFQPQVANKKDKRLTPISRRNFVASCHQLTHEDERVFEQLWRRLGLSVDWAQTYATIDSHCQTTSQRSFLDLVDKGFVYQKVAPAMWDIDFQTAVAQAEAEDRECSGAYHDISFSVDTGDSFVISTTRPELLPACIAVVAHPDDERYQHLFGRQATTPLFYGSVPILSADHADPAKGSGILMVCTFGDVHDVEWWKASGLPVKNVMNDAGCMKDVVFGEAPFDSLKPDVAQSHYDCLVGLSLVKARKAIVALLAESTSQCNGKGAALVNEPRPVMHPVKFYEKGDRPLEFRSTRQWFVRILAHKSLLIEKGRQVQWHPAYMKARYENWVEGLNQDWCLSRQRFFGVPFPVWYPILATGEVDYDHPIYADVADLPVDPQSHVPSGYQEEQRGQAGGFMGDPDVMDTWATSSMTPQIASRWGTDAARHNALFPMDLRPQSHEIIRTWAFYTIVKAHCHQDIVPWKHVMISGWILDPDRKKMSKSKGNVVTPEDLLDEYSSDAIRYWAARARLGVDTAFDPSVFSVGKKCTTKLFNAAKFVMMQIEGHDGLSVEDIQEPIDRSWMLRLCEMVDQSTRALDRFDYAVALDHIESVFWVFCDHYLELVKGRAYRETNLVKKRSALATLYLTLQTFVLCFAPYLPYMTEEISSWSFLADDESGSVHLQAWPKVADLSRAGDPQYLDAAIDILTQIRGEKTANQKSLNFPVSEVIVRCDASFESILVDVREDVVRAGSIEKWTVEVAQMDKPVIEMVF